MFIIVVASIYAEKLSGDWYLMEMEDIFSREKTKYIAKNAEDYEGTFRNPVLYIMENHVVIISWKGYLLNLRDNMIVRFDNEGPYILEVYRSRDKKSTFIDNRGFIGLLSKHRSVAFKIKTAYDTIMTVRFDLTGSAKAINILFEEVKD